MTPPAQVESWVSVGHQATGTLSPSSRGSEDGRDGGEGVVVEDLVETGASRRRCDRGVACCREAREASRGSTEGFHSRVSLELGLHEISALVLPTASSCFSQSNLRLRNNSWKTVGSSNRRNQISPHCPSSF